MKRLSYTDMLAYLGISSAHPGGNQLTKEIFMKETVSSKSKILELGCGTGSTAAFLKRSFDCEVIVLDCNDMMLKKAKKRFEREKLTIPIINGDAENLPFEENTFDLIIAESVISFTLAKEALNECQRILKKGGKLICIEMTAEGVLSKEQKEELKEAYQLKDIFTVKDWKQQMKLAGFTQLIIERNDAQGGSQNIEENEPSSYIDPQVFDILKTHSMLTEKYRKELGYRIYHCVK